MADPKKPTAPAVRMPENFDGSRRSFFRSLFSPITAIAGVKTEPGNPGIYFTANPPSPKRVIRGGSDAAVMALLGAVARGEALPFGYQFRRVSVGEDRIDVIFRLVVGEERNDLHNIAVAMLALDSTEGIARRTTASFRYVPTGDAPDAHLTGVTGFLADQVGQRDRGQLWASAAEMPRGPSRPPASPGPPGRIRRGEFGVDDAGSARLEASPTRSPPGAAADGDWSKTGKSG